MDRAEPLHLIRLRRDGNTGGDRLVDVATRARVDASHQLRARIAVTGQRRQLSDPGVHMVVGEHLFVSPGTELAADDRRGASRRTPREIVVGLRQRAVRAIVGGDDTGARPEKRQRVVDAASVAGRVHQRESAANRVAVERDQVLLLAADQRLQEFLVRPRMIEERVRMRADEAVVLLRARRPENIYVHDINRRSVFVTTKDTTDTKVNAPRFDPLCPWCPLWWIKPLLRP